MLYTKTLLTAASVAILTAVGLGSASAQPWDRDYRGDRHFDTHSRYDRHHGYVNRMQVRRSLRYQRLSVISEPFFMRGRYVVRAQDRFGRQMLVQVDPYSGRFIRRL